MKKAGIPHQVKTGADSKVFFQQDGNGHFVIGFRYVPALVGGETNEGESLYRGLGATATGIEMLALNEGNYARRAER